MGWLPLGATTLTRRRFAASSVDANGEASAGASTDSTFTGAIQPVSGADLQILPEGLRSRVGAKCVAPSGTLRTADVDGGTEPDQVIDAAGTVYQVAVVSSWSSLAQLPHDRAFLVRVAESQ